MASSLFHSFPLRKGIGDLLSLQGLALTGLRVDFMVLVSNFVTLDSRVWATATAYTMFPVSVPKYPGSKGSFIRSETRRLDQRCIYNIWNKTSRPNVHNEHTNSQDRGGRGGISLTGRGPVQSGGQGCLKSYRLKTKAVETPRTMYKKCNIMRLGYDLQDFSFTYSKFVFKIVPVHQPGRL